VEVDFYNKLSVAYDIGGVEGVKSTLYKIKTHDKVRHELLVAAEFEKRLETFKDPEIYIDKTIAEKSKEIRLLLNLRKVVIILILGILVLRVFINARQRRIRKE
jgi:hypothetical protein